MVELNRILVATDFSACSHEALEYAGELAKRFSAELHLLHVAEDPHVLLPHSGGTIPAEALASAEAQTDGLGHFELSTSSTHRPRIAVRPSHTAASA